MGTVRFRAGGPRVDGDTGHVAVVAAVRPHEVDAGYLTTDRGPVGRLDDERAGRSVCHRRPTEVGATRGHLAREDGAQPELGHVVGHRPPCSLDSRVGDRRHDAKPLELLAVLRNRSSQMIGHGSTYRSSGRASASRRWTSTGKIVVSRATTPRDRPRSRMAGVERVDHMGRRRAVGRLGPSARCSGTSGPDRVGFVDSGVRHRHEVFLGRLDRQECGQRRVARDAHAREAPLSAVLEDRG